MPLPRNSVVPTFTTPSSVAEALQTAWRYHRAGQLAEAERTYRYILHVEPRQPEALRVLARHNRIEPFESLDPEPCAGIYAEVLRPGRIRAGDPVRLG